MYPTPETYCLHSEHGQSVGTHFFISVLNFSRVWIDLSFSGSMSSHTMGPKYLIEFFPLCTVFTLGMTNDLFLLVFSLTTKLSRIIFGSIPLIALNSTMARSLIFRWCIVTELSFLNNSSKELV